MTPRPTRPLRLVALAVAMALGLAACARPPAAVVGDATIADDRLARDVLLFTFVASLSQASCGLPQEGETPASACARFTLTSLIQEELVRPFADERGVTVPEERVSRTLEGLELSVGAQELERALATHNLTRADLSALARRLLRLQAGQMAVAEATVTEGELREAYELQRAQFTTLQAAHILLATREEALQVLRRTTPDNFARMARDFSTDRGSANQGGDLGTVIAAQFDPAFVEGALALEPGEIGGPVETQFGWHVIWLVSVEVRPFEEVRGTLLESLARGAYQAWLAERAATVGVRVNPRYGRLDAIAVEVVPLRSTATGAPAP